jgi:hypothetical protein
MPAFPDLRDEVAAAFEQVFGYAPDGLWSAPGVVELRPLSLVPIERRTVLALGARDDRMLRVASVPHDELVEFDLTAPEATVPGWSAVPVGVVHQLAALGADLRAVPGADVLVDTTVDEELGALPSFANALTAALAAVWRVELGPEPRLEPVDGLIVVVPTGEAGAELALATLVEAGAREARRTAHGAIGVVDTDGVSRVQVSIDGAFAEHGLGQPEVLVAAPAARGAIRER